MKKDHNFYRKIGYYEGAADVFQKVILLIAEEHFDDFILIMEDYKRRLESV